VKEYGSLFRKLMAESLPKEESLRLIQSLV
jgi:hypothetical protein